MSPGVDVASIAAFEAMVAKARGLLERGDLAGEETRAVVAREDVERFREFVRRAEPVAIGQVRAHLPAIREEVGRIRPWLTPHDLLAVSGRSRFEDAYTELLGWSLWAAPDATGRLSMQRAWLRRVGLSERADEIEEAVQPRTQVATVDDGIIDLALQYRDFSVVVEAKTDTAEHTTPLGGYQTHAYPAAFRRLKELPPSHHIEVVFLTVDGKAAKNEAAVLATWKDCALAIVDVLTEASFDPRLTGALSMLVTHYLSDGGARGTDLVKTITACAELLGDRHELDAAVVLRELEPLAMAYENLCAGGDHEQKQ